MDLELNADRLARTARELEAITALMASRTKGSECDEALALSVRETRGLAELLGGLSERVREEAEALRALALPACLSGALNLMLPPGA